MWGIILGLLFSGTVAGGIYLFTRFQKFKVVQDLSRGRKWIRRGLALIPILIFIIFCLFDMMNSIIVLLHFMVFWALADLGAFLWRILRRKKKEQDDEKAAICRLIGDPNGEQESTSQNPQKTRTFLAGTEDIVRKR